MPLARDIIDMVSPAWPVCCLPDSGEFGGMLWDINADVGETLPVALQRAVASSARDAAVRRRWASLGMSFDVSIGRADDRRGGPLGSPEKEGMDVDEEYWMDLDGGARDYLGYAGGGADYVTSPDFDDDDVGGGARGNVDSGDMGEGEGVARHPPVEFGLSSSSLSASARSAVLAAILTAGGHSVALTLLEDGTALLFDSNERIPDEIQEIAHSANSGQAVGVSIGTSASFQYCSSVLSHSISHHPPLSPSFPNSSLVRFFW